MAGSGEKTSTKSRIRARSWCFTWNNPPVSWAQLGSLFRVCEIIKLVGQRECGESGTEHYQGVVQYRSQVSFATIKAIDSTIHWERCRNLRRSLEYVTKADTRIDGPWALGWDLPARIRTIELGQFRSWQSEMLSRIDTEQCDRSIYWIWEQRGNVGKTAFAKWLAVHRGSIVLGGKSADIKFGVGTFIKRHGKLGCACFHFTRSVEQYVSYQSIEEVKDGIFFNSKYESSMVVFNPPFILCLANFPPDLEKLSQDRWKEGIIRENYEIEWVNRESLIN